MSEQENLSSKPISRRDMLKMLGSSAAGMSLAKVAGIGGAAAALLQGMPAGAQAKVEIWTGFGQGRMADAMQGAIDNFAVEKSRICPRAHHRPLGRNP